MPALAAPAERCAALLVNITCVSPPPRPPLPLVAACAAGLTPGGRRWQPAHLSLEACPRLLSMLATAQPAEMSRPGGEKAAGGGRRRSEVGCEPQAEQGPLALLLVPPQLVPHSLELVRQAVEASSSKRSAQGSDFDSWCAQLAEQVAAIYSSCYQAMWGAQVLQSADAYQLLLPASRMRMLLRVAAGQARFPPAGAADGEAEAAAEAALLAQNAVGIRQRRQRSSGLAGLGRAPPGAASVATAGALPPVKRYKIDRSAPAVAGSASGSSAVAELLQLFNPGASNEAQERQPQGGKLQHTREEPTEVAPGQQQQQQQRRRIVPQQLQPGPASAPMQDKEEDRQQPAEGEEAGEEPDRGADDAAGYQRVIISKTDGMTGDCVAWL